MFEIQQPPIRRKGKSRGCSKDTWNHASRKKTSSAGITKMMLPRNFDDGESVIYSYNLDDRWNNYNKNNNNDIRELGDIVQGKRTQICYDNLKEQPDVFTTANNINNKPSTILFIPSVKKSHADKEVCSFDKSAVNNYEESDVHCKPTSDVCKLTNGHCTPTPEHCKSYWSTVDHCKPITGLITGNHYKAADHQCVKSVEQCNPSVNLSLLTGDQCTSTLNNRLEINENAICDPLNSSSYPINVPNKTVHSIKSQYTPVPETRNMILPDGRKPVVGDRKDEKKPVVGDPEDEKKPVVGDRKDEKKPVVGDPEDEKKPVVGDRKDEKKPVVGDPEDEKKPVVGDRKDEKKPVVGDPEDEKKPVVGDPEDEKKPIGHNCVNGKYMRLIVEKIKVSPSSVEKCSKNYLKHDGKGKSKAPKPMKRNRECKSTIQREENKTFTRSISENRKLFLRKSVIHHNKRITLSKKKIHKQNSRITRYIASTVQKNKLPSKNYLKLIKLASEMQKRSSGSIKPDKTRILPTQYTNDISQSNPCRYKNKVHCQRYLNLVKLVEEKRKGNSYLSKPENKKSLPENLNHIRRNNIPKKRTNIQSQNYIKTGKFESELNMGSRFPVAVRKPKSLSSEYNRYTTR